MLVDCQGRVSEYPDGVERMWRGSRGELGLEARHRPQQDLRIIAVAGAALKVHNRSCKTSFDVIE